MDIEPHDPVVELTLPSHWATYLVNGYTDGLESAELTQIARALKRHGLTPADCVDVGDDEFFAWHNDATMDGVVVAVYTFHRDTA